MTKYSIKKSIPINRPDIPILSLSEYEMEKGEITLFEQSFQDWLECKNGFIMTASGKMSIFLVFEALQLKGNVIAAPLSCNMAYAPLIALGIQIKFVDINPATLNIDEEEVVKHIDDKTSAIYATHLGGVSPNMHILRQIADENNLLLIEDCAQALGSTYGKTKLGLYGDFATFSFAKNLWLAGGGGIFSRNTKVIDRVKEIQDRLSDAPYDLIRYRFERDFLESQRGLSDEHDAIYYKQFVIPAKNANVGVNYHDYFTKKHVYCKPIDLQAKILLKQLSEMDKKNARRKENASLIIEGLKDYYTFQSTENQDPVYSKLYLYPKKIVSNQELLPILFNKGIDAKHLTKSHGIHLQERFDLNHNFSEFTKNSSLNNYVDIHDRILAIPISSNMNKTEIDYIINILTQEFPK